MFENGPGLLAQCPGQVPSAGKNHYGRAFEQSPARAGPFLLRPAREDEFSRAGVELYRPCGTRAALLGGAIVRELQRVLAPTVAIWHSDRAGRPYVA